MKHFLTIFCGSQIAIQDSVFLLIKYENWHISHKEMSKAIYYAAAGTGGLAGILHLLIAPNVIGFNLNAAIFFIVSGIAQLFWVIPMSRHWGKPWYYAGIVGTIILTVLWATTRMPNPITVRALPVDAMGISVELLQVAFIGLTAMILVAERRAKTDRMKTAGLA
jgi:hypothetical protein